MLLIYTGNGKGKTSASVGQALRAHGQGLAVAFGQFMKRRDQAGEQKILAELLGRRFFADGPGFFRSERERREQRRAAAALLRWAREMLAPEDCAEGRRAGEGRAPSPGKGVDMLVLDESLYALGHGLVSPEEMQSLVESARGRGAHLVLSGRGLPAWLEAEADMITEMTERRHHFTEGRRAAPGREF
ncbi:MAG: cob(I)yrinic acid a,c-diamide adenosyltransferase [Desulfovibrio sp.]|jgi:cob(I)alamin adenosyltransferase|nr:cob(I)yrinic acid a,c-diamide adenosyltransferase [Desulfovibrio sp.]